MQYAIKYFLKNFLSLSVSLYLFLFSFSFNALADQSLLNNNSAMLFTKEMVNKYHFDKNYVVNALKTAKYQQNIIDAMEHPYEKKTWDVYQNLFVTEARIQHGIEFWKNNHAALQAAEIKFGVPADLIVAIIGIETLYGKNQGNYRVLDALTTLAFYYPKRDAFFKKELREYLLLCREHGVSPDKYLGSYAGAMGKPQFMPSSYRYYAVSAHGKKQIDLMNDDHDVIGSVANYFYRNGWKPNEPVAVPVSAKREGILELETKKGQEYWKAYHNFYVITKYNTSPQYALAAYILSKKLRQQWALVKIGNHAHA